MDLAFSAQERAFRDEVREFIATHLPDDIRRKVQAGDHLVKDDYARWHRILHERGWVAAGWPVEFGGRAEHHPLHDRIVSEEILRARAPFTIERRNPPE